MTHVVERCPSCGVEHDIDRADACEACHTPLRPWCRRHGREIGWLDGPACPRCAEEAARRPASPPATPPPAADPGRRVLRGLGPPASPPAPVRRPVDLAPGRPLREVLRDGGGAGRTGHRASDTELVTGAALTVLLGLGGGGLLGVIAGLVYAIATGGSMTEAPLEWGMTGAVLGLIVTFIVSLLGMAQSSSRE